MPKAVYKQLNHQKIRNAKKPGLHLDGRGLYLRVTSNGAKSWVFRVQIEGKPRAIGLGSLRDVSLAEARETTERLHRAIREGRDPIEERDGKSDGLLFREAADQYYEQHHRTWKNAKHRQQWRNTMKSYVLPMIGELGVDQISSADVLRALDPIWQAKPETARRVKQRIRAVLDWAIARGYRTTINPVDATSKALPAHIGGKKHHAALPYVELPALLDDLRASGSHRFIRLGLEFLIHTATRTSETMGARWDEIDGDVWIIPAARMKASREHRVPLTEPVMEILDQARKRLFESPYIFPGRDWNKTLSNMAFAMALRRMRYETITVHGFRSSFRDWTAERTNFPRDVCEAALAHTVHNQVEAAYRRTDLFEKRKKLMTQWSAFLTESKSADVIALER